MGVGNGGPWLMDTTTTSMPVATYSAIHHPPSPPVILRKWENEGIYTLWWWSWPRLLLWCRDALNSYVFCPNLPRTWERNRFSIPSRCLQFPLHLPENAFFASWYCWIPLQNYRIYLMAKLLDIFEYLSQHPTCVSSKKKRKTSNLSFHFLPQVKRYNSWRLSFGV